MTAPYVREAPWFRRFPNGGTVYERNAMTTTPEPSAREVELEALVEQQQAAREAREEEFRLSVQELQGRPTQEAYEAMTAQRNNARQLLSEQNQEVDRLKSVLQEMVAGITSWVPDLTPVPAPPPELEPAVAQAWVRDQIAGRRAEWDTFVNRVVTQATV